MASGSLGTLTRTLCPRSMEDITIYLFWILRTKCFSKYWPSLMINFWQTFLFDKLLSGVSFFLILCHLWDYFQNHTWTLRWLRAAHQDYFRRSVSSWVTSSPSSRHPADFLISAAENRKLRPEAANMHNIPVTLPGYWRPARKPWFSKNFLAKKLGAYWRQIASRMLFMR